MVKKIFIGLIYVGIIAMLVSCAEGNRGARVPTPTIVALPSPVEQSLEPTSTTVVPTPIPLPTETPQPTRLTLSTSVSITPKLIAEVENSVQAEPILSQPVETPTPANTAQLSGEWEFNFGTMTLHQDTVRITGNYLWYGGIQGGKIQAHMIYDTHQARGLWVSDADSTTQGFVRWRLVEGRLQGTFEDNGVQGQWCAVRAGNPLPPGCGFSGAWNIYFSSPTPTTGQATLTQVGGMVTGTYSTEDGRQGEIFDASLIIRSTTEATLEGHWREADGSTGTFEWRLNQTDNQSFEGRRSDGNSEWCGWREEAPKPKPCGF